MLDSDAIREIARQGAQSREAMRLLYERHHGRAVKHMRFSFPALAIEEVEDLVAQGFVQAFAKTDTYRGQCEAGTWLISIVRNLALDFLRKNTRWQHDEEAVMDLLCPASEPDSSLLGSRLRQCVQTQFNEFRRKHPQAATLLWERHCNETSAKDMAVQQEKSHDAMRQYLSKWAEHLRQYLSRCRDLLDGD